MNKTKLYTICYKDEHLNSTTEGSDAWDNLENPQPELCEFPVFKRAYSKIMDTDLDYWGFVSPKFAKKTNITGKTFLDWIAQDEGKANVYFINPVPIVESLFYSTVHHGENCHPGMLGLLQRNLSWITENKLETMYMDCNTFVLCNYFVGDRLFWSKYLQFVDEFIDSVNKNPADMKLMYESGANYGPDKSLPFYTFVIERLFSIFLKIYQSEIKVKHYPYSREQLIAKTGLSEIIVDELQALTDIKQMAVSAGYTGMMQHWTFFRNRLAQQNQYLFLME